MSYNTEMQPGVCGAAPTTRWGSIPSLPTVKGLSLPPKFKNLKKKLTAAGEITPDQWCLLFLHEMHGIDSWKLVRCVKTQPLDTLETYLSLLHYPVLRKVLILRFPDIQGSFVIAYFRASETIAGSSLGSMFGKSKSEEHCICISAFDSIPKMTGSALLTYFMTDGIPHLRTWVREREFVYLNIATVANALSGDFGDTTINLSESLLQGIFPSMYPKGQVKARVQNLLEQYNGTIPVDGGE